MKQWLGKVHPGDAVETPNRMPVESVDAVVTSPPYTIKNATGNDFKDGRGGKWPGVALQAGYSNQDDNMPHEEYVAWQRKCLTAMMRVLRNDGAIFYNYKWRVQDGLLQDRSDIVAGFPVRQILIWQQAGGINVNPGYFLPNYEVIYLICKPRFRLAKKANAIGCVWPISPESKNPHPAPFPVELAQRCIESTTGRIVLDPFMGSGTTALAANAVERQWIGVELSEAYCNLARERIAGNERLVNG